ncbi:MAG: hypothetical protein J3Q66DRAFT_348206 [Benniella sp.]|nr:MAG: hypothetical protein J3Q66DRAFT_348206 [Benniella sp.]
MPFVETLESYSRALYLPLRGYVHRPFQLVSESIRGYVPESLWDAHKTVWHGILRFRGILESLDGRTPAIHDLNSNSTGTSAGQKRVGGTSSGGSTGPNNRAGLGHNGAGFKAAAGGKSVHHNQPTILQFFLSPYFLLLCFMSIVMNRINAIVAPRNPHPLKLSVRFALKLPAFFLLMKSALTTLALLTEDRSTIPMAWMISGLKTSYTESQALWLSFVALGVSCMLDSFVNNLNSSGPHEQTINMLEWAILYHFTPSGKDVLIISVIEVCQQLTLQFLSLSTRGRNYRLIATTFWGVLDLLHFTYAVYHQSDTYPILQVVTRLPEVVVIIMVFISLVLHALTFIVTGGNVRKQVFEPRAMPTMDEEYGVAVFKLGRACMEATRGANFRNEVDAVVVPVGTILDNRKEPSLRKSSNVTAADPSQGETSTQPGPSRLFTTGVAHNNNGRTPPSGFSNEMVDIVETPAQRQQPSRRRDRINVMRAFYRSSASLVVEAAYGLYNKVVPERFRRVSRETQESNAEMQEDFIQFRATIANVLELARQTREHDLQQLEAEHYQIAAALDEEEEEELYTNFLSRDLTASDDEDEIYDVDYRPQEDEDEDGDNAFESESEYEGDAGSEEQGSYGMQRRHSVQYESSIESSTEMESDSSEQGSRWGSLESLQDFFLDTSFMSIFLSVRLQDTPLTRSQHRLTMSGAREFQQDAIEYNNGEGSSRYGGLGRIVRTKKSTSNEPDSRALLSVLNKYRKSTMIPSNVGSTGSSSGVAPPPLARFLEEDGSIHSRLLCVVCQCEPRGVILRPCRCLALCNDCREVLASRRFKQCPCCRSDVQGFSRVYLP